MVRHHLTDDWAFASDTEKRPWEFRNSENDIKNQCTQFNKAYSSDDDEWSSTAHIVDDSEVRILKFLMNNIQSKYSLEPESLYSFQIRDICQRLKSFQR